MHSQTADKNNTYLLIFHSDSLRATVITSVIHHLHLACFIKQVYYHITPAYKKEKKTKKVHYCSTKRLAEKYISLIHNIFMPSTKASNPPQNSHKVNIMQCIFHSKSDSKATLLVLLQGHQVVEPMYNLVQTPLTIVLTSQCLASVV